jgi:pyruvate/2-oxoglutarate dehydrogenase complex dihydrolipoamide dehydrogenase (E3) component
VPHFSLVIIGSGSGNLVVPEDPAQGTVALIDSGAFGGTCVNRGCIPSKILIRTAELAAQVRHAPEFGIQAKLTGVDWSAIRDRTFAKTGTVSAAGRGSQIEVAVSGGPPVTGELLLVAAGRVPDTADLDLDRAGVRLREDGRIEVDEYGRTTAEGIWSLGDASTPYPLKHVANAEARTLAHNLAFGDDLRPYPHDWVPAAVFTEPQIATVGAREQDLSRECRYVTAVQEYADVAYGWALQDTTGFCKLYADAASGTLLGAHIMGYQASLLIQPLVQAAAAGQRIADLARGQYWIHPALSEVVENALLKLPLEPAASPVG